MWRNDLGKRLRDVAESKGLKWLLPDEDSGLQLRDLGCAILFHEEFFFILKRLEELRPNIGTSLLQLSIFPCSSFQRFSR